MPTTPKTQFQLDAQGRWYIDHDKDSTLDYTVSFEKWLAKIDATLTDHEIVLPGDTELTLVQSDASADGVITALLSGGTTLDSMQAVTYRITAGSLVDDRTVYLKVVER